MENRPEKTSPVQLHTQEASTQTMPQSESKEEASTQTMPDGDLLVTCFLMPPESERLPLVTKLLQIVSARS